MANALLKKEDLKNYISVVYQLEQAKYSQEQAIEKIERQVYDLTDSYISEKPAAVKLEKADYCVGFKVILAIAIAVAIVTGLISSAVLIIIGLIVGVILIISASDSSKKNKSAMAKNKAASDKYKKDMDRYNETKARAEAREKLAEALQGKLSVMYAKLGEITRDLNRAYSYDIIYTSYRNLIAVSSFNDYLLSNRCDGLEGHEGAYNLFNMESRLDKIITRLDDVCRNLEAIKYTQNALYNTMQETNSMVEKMQSSLSAAVTQLDNISYQTALTNESIEKLECTAEINRFNTEQARREIELRNRVDGISSTYIR